MEIQQLKNEAGNTPAITIFERLFYLGTSITLFVFSGLFAPSAKEIRTLSFSAQYPDWEMAGVIFAVAVLIGYHAVAPRKK
jgi:hypothetical protein